MSGNKNKPSKEIIWRPIFSREGFSYFIASLAFEGYVLDMKKRIGWGYRDQLLVSRRNFLTVYGSTRDELSFSAYAARKHKKFFIEINNLIAAELRKAEKGVNQVNTLLKKKEITAREMENILTIFYDHYRGLYSVYRFSTLLDHYYRGKFRENLIKKFSRIKDLCGKFFSKTDKSTLNIIKNRLSRLFDAPANLILSLNFQEIVGSIQRGKLAVGKDELKSRYNFYILSAMNRRIKLVTKKRNQFLKNNVFSGSSEEKTNEIKGQIACRGKAKGRVKVAFLAGHLKKAVSGSILVTPMTTINHTPFLKKFSAIVTDEGGITSHAAIVSRELGVPCVIGTKIATKVFKDGDLVEVDADRGVVRKIS